MEKEYQYLEIRKYSGGDDEVVRRIDVTGRNSSSIYRIDDGININLNHDEYYTIDRHSETELPTI